MEEVLGRLRAARARQLEVLETLERRLQEVEQELLKLQDARDLAEDSLKIRLSRGRGTKKAAGVLAAASFPATVAMSIAFGPLGLFGLLGLGLGAGVAASLDATDRDIERAFAAEKLKQTSNIRALEELKGRIVRKRVIVEEKLRRTRSLLDKLT
jgi:hypothetical protein